MYDLVIRQARIVDGSGASAFMGDIGVVGQRIAALGPHLTEEAHQVIEAGGQVVAPGFVDAHTHDDLAVLRRSIVPPKVQQGITTLVIGNCGFGLAPVTPIHSEALKTYSAAVLGEDAQRWGWRTMGAFLEALRSMPLGQHVRALLGHTALRVAVMGFEPRAATEQEIIEQEALVSEAMQAGAAGLSLGLMYVPGIYTPTTELVRLARVVGRYKGVVTTHMRGEGDSLLSSIDEMLTIAEQAQVAMHISHLKITGRQNWGHIDKALHRIADARARGLDVTVDVYPYTAGSTTITQLLPPWVLEGGVSSMVERLRDPASRQRIRRDFANGLPGWENQVAANGWERIRLSTLQQAQYKPLEGMSIIEAAETLGMPPDEALFHLVTEEQGRITILIFSMDDRDVDQVVQSPFSMIGSDGLPILSGRPHPRLYGTFPRFIKRYVRDLRSLELEQAIHKVTALPAARFGLSDHGMIAEGKVADLVIFDPALINDRATYSDPQLYPEGISAVIVSGQPVVLNGQLQANLPGQLLAPGRDAMM
ncbi:MAG TPA: D-aminoacylase [Ktedonosporobacter sp.]|nr:D-aminoacylase [Ktedonosporobacter sp.]